MVLAMTGEEFLVVQVRPRGGLFSYVSGSCNLTSTYLLVCQGARFNAGLCNFCAPRLVPPLQFRALFHVRSWAPPCAGRVFQGALDPAIFTQCLCAIGLRATSVGMLFLCHFPLLTSFMRMLPLNMKDGVLTVAAPFRGRVGFTQQF